MTMDVAQTLKTRIMNLSDDDLLKMAYIESIDYSEEAIQFAVSEVKKRGLKELNIRHCPRCRKGYDVTVPMCQCGYNFETPNIVEIKQLEKKRLRNNRIAGLGMVIIFGFFYLYHPFSSGHTFPAKPTTTIGNGLNKLTSCNPLLQMK